MNISIFGMGYVGCILAAGHASQEHKITGVDVNQKKLDILNEGKSPISEKGIDGYIDNAVKKQLLKTTINVDEAIKNSEMSLISVGTPCKENGEINTDFTGRVCEDIAQSLKEKENYHLIVFKSTLFPGTVENKLIPLIERVSGKKAGKDFGVCHNPEFLREGSGMEDFFNPPVTVIGQLDERSGDLLEQIYTGINGDIVRTTIKIGEMIKYVNNTFHGLKVTFANEIGKIAKQLCVDSHELMKIFCMDKQLNLSPYYLKPGVPYGGSCLTKDLEALKFEAKKRDLNTPILDSIKKSNDAHISYCTDLVEKTNEKNIGILGLSFKENTDDLRSSAIILIIERLIKKGFNVKVYDKTVAATEKFGANKNIIERQFPFLKDILVDEIGDIMKQKVIIIKNRDEEYKKITNFLKEDQIIIDMVRLFEKKDIKAAYIGLCW
ncbi:nucleotide sugar dehydrogenase [Candidatus Woesearchaeota archaeon]|nr:nucleotide sugar dehydrogenase [Candidatus Woesearchaeota archaeon]